MLFSLFYPLLMWSGFVYYPLVCFGLYTVPMFTGCVYVCIRMMPHLVSPSWIKRLFRHAASSATREIIVLDEVESLDTGPLVRMLVPHGSFCLAAMCDTVVQTEARFHLMIDATLCTVSPMTSWVGGLFGCTVGPLRDTAVKERMSHNVNIAVCPGGFVEAAGYSTNTEVIYTKQYTYWMKRCREHGYRLQLKVFYEGSRFYTQPGTMRNLRMWVARRHMPCILPFPACTKPTLYVRTMDIGLSMSLDEVNKMIVDTYTRDADLLRREYGTTVKTLQLV